MKIRINAPNTYRVLKSEGIAQSTVEAALNGDVAANAQIADYKIKQEKRAHNAKAVFSNLSTGMEKGAEVALKEAEFVLGAGKAIAKAGKAWSDGKLADNATGIGMTQVAASTAYGVKEQNYQATKTMSLLKSGHDGNLRIIDIRHRGALTKQGQHIQQARTQILTPTDRAKDTLAQVQKQGSKAASGVGGFFRRMFGNR